jgi:hypothetical protein
MCMVSFPTTLYKAHTIRYEEVVDSGLNVAPLVAGSAVLGHDGSPVPQKRLTGKEVASGGFAGLERE